MEVWCWETGVNSICSVFSIGNASPHKTPLNLNRTEKTDTIQGESSETLALVNREIFLALSMIGLGESYVTRYRR